MVVNWIDHVRAEGDGVKVLHSHRVACGTLGRVQLLRPDALKSVAIGSKVEHAAVGRPGGKTAAFARDGDPLAFTDSAPAERRNVDLRARNRRTGREREPAVLRSERYVEKAVAAVRQQGPALSSAKTEKIHRSHLGFRSVDSQILSVG